jgi:hypothetical protein
MCQNALCVIYYPGTPDGLATDLDNVVANFRVNALALSTRRTYLQYLRMYVKFCDELRVPLVPLSATNLGRYIAYMSTRLSFSSMRNYLSVVRLLHIESGFPNPIQSHFISSVIKGAKRVMGTTLLKNSPLPRPSSSKCSPI